MHNLNGWMRCWPRGLSVWLSVFVFKCWRLYPLEVTSSFHLESACCFWCRLSSPA